MPILQIIKDLIGKEDISWGDSSTTFARETHTGGSINMHYTDAEVIPSTTLGGYIGDHLHVQNTDSLTTATTFGINSGGNSLVLSSSGLTASRTITFPNTSNQTLIGATDLVSIAASKGATLVGIQDSGNYFSGANVEAITQELGSDVSTLQTETHNRGMKNGFIMAYSSTTAITIGGGMWAHTGTTNRHVYLSSQITFTLGPGGSNASSTALGANQIHYLYLDDSAIVAAATSLLTASEFLNSTTAPVYSHSKAGWYSTNDRCIGAVLTNASNEVLSFAVFGSHFYRYASPVTEYTTAAAATTYTALDISSSVPRFCTRARLRITSVSAGTVLYFDTSSTATTPECATFSTANTPEMADVPLTAAQLSYYYASAGNNIDVDTSGYYTDEL
uniref:Uncharacterized protein n=1 Tax=viral metagenome TaxID=1070528 RepID=A0A6M3XQB3_9ZZZZ